MHLMLQNKVAAQSLTFKLCLSVSIKQGRLLKSTITDNSTCILKVLGTSPCMIQNIVNRASKVKCCVNVKDLQLLTPNGMVTLLIRRYD